MWNVFLIEHNCNDSDKFDEDEIVSSVYLPLTIQPSTMDKKMQTGLMKLMIGDDMIWGFFWFWD